MPRPIEFLRFVEGDPGVPGDGFSISATGGGINADPVAFELATPFQLGGITNGITLTAFFPGANLTYEFVIYTATLNSTGVCRIFSNFVDDPNVLKGTVLFDGVAGVFQNVPQSSLESILNATNIFLANRGCNGITLNELFITGIALMVRPNIVTNVSLDAAAIGLGQNTVP